MSTFVKGNIETKLFNKKSTVAQKNKVSLAKLLRIRERISKKYKNTGLEKFRLPITKIFGTIYTKFNQLLSTKFHQQFCSHFLFI
jgi:hypothetical protein